MPIVPLGLIHRSPPRERRATAEKAKAPSTKKYSSPSSAISLLLLFNLYLFFRGTFCGERRGGGSLTLHPCLLAEGGRGRRKGREG